jgi:hypothetical protein
MNKTPEQEALDIYTSILYILPSDLDKDSSVEQVSKHLKQEHETAKKIAINTVNILLEATKTEVDRPEFCGTVYNKHYQEVKKELDKL